MLTEVEGVIGNWRNALTDVPAIKQQLDAWVYKNTGGIVQSGPFKDMKLLSETAWQHTYLTPLLLGCYEEELQNEIERQINRLKDIANPKIAVIGSAEGYYAIGMKYRLPHATVFAVEPDEASVDICGRAAAANNTSVVIAPMEVVMESPDLIIMDCEGNEVFYCDTERWPQLCGVHMIVEAHNFLPSDVHPGQKTDDILVERFRGSHRINMVVEGPRNPNRHQLLAYMTSDYRWLAMSEGRPCLMGWLVMEPRGLYCP